MLSDFFLKLNLVVNPKLEKRAFEREVSRSLCVAAGPSAGEDCESQRPVHRGD